MKKLCYPLIFACMISDSGAKELPECPANFITEALLDSSGVVWVATEDHGILTIDLAGNAKWTYVKNKDEDKDEKSNDSGQQTDQPEAEAKAKAEANFPTTKHFYALEEDLQGRIWVGSSNQGAAVWNGKTWKIYNQSNALLGERVFDIQVSPTNGDVAIATSGGLSIYSPNSDSWQDFTRSNGLPEDQIYTMSFAADGTLWVGFATSGVGWASPQDRYQKWNNQQTKWYFDEVSQSRQPLEPHGHGLPSNLCNTILAHPQGILLGTTSGLAKSKNGAQWQFLRGEDYFAKNEGLYYPPGAKKPKINRISPSTTLLPEDYITCFYPSNRGVWVGFRQKGLALLHPDTLRVQKVAHNLKLNSFESFVTSLITLPDGKLYATTYGAGFHYIDQLTNPPRKPRLHEQNLPALPSEPPVLTNTQIAQAIQFFTPLAEVGSTPVPPKSTPKAGATKQDPPFQAIYLFEDWATQGDWCQRYGQTAVTLCGAHLTAGGVGHDFSSDNFGVLDTDIGISKGLHRSKDDHYVLSKVDWDDMPDRRSALYCTHSMTRIVSKWDDAVQVYPQKFDGPDLWVIADTSPGRNLLSIYMYDPSPLETEEYEHCLRDYVIEVRKLPADYKLSNGEEMDEPDEKKILEERLEISHLPILARTRVKWMAGDGVYKNFITNGGERCFVRISRNYSTSAHVNGVFMSSFDEAQKAQYRFESSTHTDTPYIYGKAPPKPPQLTEDDYSRLPANLFSLWVNSQDVFYLNPTQILQNRRWGIYALRSLNALPQQSAMTANWRWRMRIWTESDKEIATQQLKDAWEGWLNYMPANRSSEFNKFGAGTTIPFSEWDVRKMSDKGIDWRQYRPDSKVKPALSIEEMKAFLNKK